MDLSNFEFKKRLGQNFLIDPNLLSAICRDAEVGAEDEVFEIGAGGGTLTEALAKCAKKVVAVEIDKDLMPILQQSFENTKNVTLVQADILKMKNSEIASYFNRSFKVVANLPYYITTPVIFKLMEDDLPVTDLTLMVQKEVGERMVARPGTKEYGVLTVKINAIADVQMTRIVTRRLFMPQPNVDSVVLKITFHKDKNKISDKTLFYKVVETGFAMRRKTLANNLMSAFGFSRSIAENILVQSKLPMQVRGETLTTEQYVTLADKVAQFVKNLH